MRTPCTSYDCLLPALSVKEECPVCGLAADTKDMKPNVASMCTWAIGVAATGSGSWTRMLDLYAGLFRCSINCLLEVLRPYPVSSVEDEFPRQRRRTRTPYEENTRVHQRSVAIIEWCVWKAGGLAVLLLSSTLLVSILSTLCMRLLQAVFCNFRLPYFFEN